MTLTVKSDVKLGFAVFGIELLFDPGSDSFILKPQ